jgi:hypothetical protein
MSTGGKIVLGVIGTIVGIVLLTYLGTAIGLITLPARVVNEAVTPEKVIFNYEYFHQTYQDIKATSVKIKTAYEAMNMPNLTEDQKTVYTTNYIGVQNYIQSLTAEYNARSKMLTRRLFKDKQLPYQITVTVIKGDVKITEEE